MKNDNHGLKLLVWSFFFAAIAGFIAIQWEKYHPNNKGWTGAMASVHLHSDRPIEWIADDIRDDGKPKIEREWDQHIRDHGSDQGGPSSDSGWSPGDKDA
jgi:hypothetical protein